MLHSPLVLTPQGECIMGKFSTIARNHGRLWLLEVLRVLRGDIVSPQVKLF